MRFLFLTTYTLLVLSTYAYATCTLFLQAKPLEKKCCHLAAKHRSIQECNKKLSEMTSSLSDPAADEYGMITSLGTVPEGYYKIILEKKS